MLKNNKSILRLLLAAIILLPAHLVNAQNLETFEQNVTEFTLDNGLHFIIVERNVAPVAHFFTLVDVGSANEPVGRTGIAHIYEHMVFKGSKTIGTTNYEEEVKYIDQMDDAYKAWLREYNKFEPDEEKLDELWAAFQELQEKAGEFVVNNEFTQIIEREGASGVNAFASTDATGYFYSLPQNKAELWFMLEADRFINPVMREFYIEKDVIYEERRQRTDSNPFGRLLEEFASTAYSAHPYKNPIVGWPSDIRNTTIADTWEYHDKFYAPSSFTITIVGDVDPAEMRRLAEKYFNPMEYKDPAPELLVEEPEQRGERRFVIEEQSQPIYMEGYHTVNNQHPDYQALNLLAGILTNGRTSRLYRKMVVEDQSALQVGAQNGYPGSKYQGMFIKFVIPNQGVDMADVEQTLRDEQKKIIEEGVTEEELERVRTNTRAGLVRTLTSNTGIARTLAFAHVNGGDWRTAFTDLERLNDVTVEDIQRVAETYLKKSNRTVGMIQNVQDDGEMVSN
ncbi:insulinase family protein [Rhodohalobacter sp. SW132]|uniref:M16 family metallopeptidase n=1 Tax=Rhodohalobacter sp. SW132 TaxID=2293433 RepID=UPI000E235B37|nr:pitrilysin family protein [Rhodohalobacter sp. SW132]REL29145.1 insulinase family protein [Rhodohalobacter sp. SW132]